MRAGSDCRFWHDNAMLIALAFVRCFSNGVFQARRKMVGGRGFHTANRWSWGGRRVSVLVYTLFTTNDITTEALLPPLWRRLDRLR